LPGNKTLIFSDVHLRVAPAHRARTEAFLAFLRQFSPDEFDRIVCLGDLFDFWFEYEHVIFSGYFEVLRAFADLRDAGVEIHLVCGNHDFWAGKFLRETMGFHVHANAVTLPFGELRAHFVHGDGIDPADRKYRIYKRIARNPFIVWLFRQIHPDWAMRIAQTVSHSSRRLLEREDVYNGPSANALREHAARVLAAGDADVVMSGHAHAPEKTAYETPNGTGWYINSGDRLRHRSYVVWDGSDFHLTIEYPDGDAPKN